VPLLAFAGSGRKKTIGRRVASETTVLPEPPSSSSPGKRAGRMRSNGKGRTTAPSTESLSARTTQATELKSGRLRPGTTRPVS